MTFPLRTPGRHLSDDRAKCGRSGSLAGLRLSMVMRVGKQWRISSVAVHCWAAGATRQWVSRPR
jgi:hypothetical protein